MFERFTREARQVVTRAVEEAQVRGDNRIGTEHLLIGVAGSESMMGLLPEPVAIRSAMERLDEAALESVGLDPGLLRLAEPAHNQRRGVVRHLPFNNGAKGILKGALREALDLGNRHIGVEHIALALTRVTAPDRALALFEGLDLDPDALRAALLHRFRHAS